MVAGTNTFGLRISNFHTEEFHAPQSQLIYFHTNTHTHALV